MSNDSRRHIRFAYPIENQGTFVIAGEPCTIIDICESGLKFVWHSHASKSVTEVSGEVRLVHGFCQGVSGRIIRHIRELYVIELSHPLPFAAISYEYDCLVNAGLPPHET